MFLSADLKIKIANQIKINDILTADTYQYYIKLYWVEMYFYNKFVTEKYLLTILLLHISSEILIAYFYDNFIVLMEILLSLNILSFVQSL